MESFTRELTLEEEEQMINKIASEVIKRRLEAVAIMFLESIKPMSYIGSQLAMVFVGPFLAIFGDLGINYIKFFDKRDNVEKLLRKIEEEVKTRDEEEKKAKEESKSITKRFSLRLDLLPGFLLREEATRSEERSGTIGISGKESIGGLVTVAFEKADNPPPDLAQTMSDQLTSERVRQALMLSQETLLKETKREELKIRGHKACMTTYEWSDSMGQRGRVESYSFWCNKTQRYFLIGLRTRPLKGDKTEKDHIRDLRMILGSMKCH